MPLSDFEQQQLHLLEAQLARERRLVRLTRRLGTAGGDLGVRRTSVLAGAGGIAGLILALTALVTHAAALGTASVAVLTATVVLSGVALIVLGVSGYRRDQRLTRGRLASIPGERIGGRRCRRPRWPGRMRPLQRDSLNAAGAMAKAVSGRAAERAAVTCRFAGRAGRRALLRRSWPVEVLAESRRHPPRSAATLPRPISTDYRTGNRG